MPLLVFLVPTAPHHASSLASNCLVGADPEGTAPELCSPGHIRLSQREKGAAPLPGSERPCHTA